MTAGDVIKAVETVWEDGLSKTNTAITKGLVLAFDTDGLESAGADEPGPHYMSEEDVAAGGAGVQTEFKVVKRGWVKLSKAAGGGTAIPAYSYVKSDANGQVVPFVPGTDLAEEIVGYTGAVGAADADTECAVFLGGR